MKNSKFLYFFTFMIFLSINCFSQISFQEGYFINNAGKRTPCQIKNLDWKNNPTEFEYRLADSPEILLGTIATVQEFGVDNVSKFIRSTVDIDRSNENANQLSEFERPVFEKEQLFLKVLVNGKASLLFYQEGNLKRYFYMVDSSQIDQLIYKSYLTEDHKLGKNNGFRQQLWNDLKCPSIPMGSIETVDYVKKDLVNIFVRYNDCENSSSINFTQSEKRDLFNLTLRPGLTSSSLALQNSVSEVRNIDFDKEMGFRFGAEVEIVMPFNKDKWSFIVEPTYQSYRSEQNITYVETNTMTRTTDVTVDYSSIEIPFGIRHYSFLGEHSKMFFNASFVFDLPLDKTIKAEASNIINVEMTTRSNLAFGLGYRYNNKYNIEFRYATNREVLSDYPAWNSTFKNISLIFGYTLL